TDWSWAPLFADFDNDGNKDLFISSGIVKRPVDLDYIKFASDLKNKGMDRTDQFDDEAIDGMPDGSSHPFLFRNNSDGTFQEVSDDWGTGKMKGYFNGSSYADLDNDGKLDLVINQLNGKAVILKNNAPAKNYLSVSFKGDSLNTMGVGVKLYVFSKSKIQYQQLMLTRGFESSSEPRLHFGLDTISIVDSILVVWPGQQYQVIKKVTVNLQLIIQKNNADGRYDQEVFFPITKPVFEDITNQVNINWKHTENDFLDYNVQYLIPHLESTRGPKIATGDVNKDGLDDFYVCGARFQPGALMLQQPDGSFFSSDTTVFSKDAICEDVDASFFDANGDDFPDLYVVSGGNEVPVNNYSVRDRLYLNNGKGNFIKAENFITPVHENKSCVTTADFDKDGDLDLFVGNLANPKAYGLPTTSHLYTNDGKAHFTLSNQSISLFTSIGMITAAYFADINNDSWADLIVTGEWMAVKIFINNKGSFKETNIPSSTGLWQTLKVADINGDGFTDILAGNWGHNSKLYAGKNGPLKLYIKDFDKNGSVEQVMAYTVNGKEYTFLAKDELERSLPVLKKAYLKYGDVAGKTVQYMFYDLFKDYQELKAETLSSSCFMNDGKGNFTRTDLPGDLQIAPIFSFSGIVGNTDPAFIAAGNFYGTTPYEGRYDALLPTIFSFNKTTNNLKINNILPSDMGEVRDIKYIKTIGGKNIIVVARNNKPLLFLKPIEY
ncbi:MAG: VCBS repeat-containing protein, partial [Chitinophagaceae bacterium]